MKQFDVIQYNNKKATILVIQDKQVLLLIGKATEWVEKEILRMLMGDKT